MGESALYEALRKGAPLVEFTIRFLEGINDVEATEQLNSIADDFHLNPRPWYDDPSLRLGSATKEALERLFGWRFKRTLLERFDENTGTRGHWPDVYCWEELSPITRCPVDGIIQEIAISQPGADDDGQWYE